MMIRTILNLYWQRMEKHMYRMAKNWTVIDVSSMHFMSCPSGVKKIPLRSRVYYANVPKFVVAIYCINTMPTIVPVIRLPSLMILKLHKTIIFKYGVSWNNWKPKYNNSNRQQWVHLRNVSRNYNPLWMIVSIMSFSPVPLQCNPFAERINECND